MDILQSYPLLITSLLGGAIGFIIPLLLIVLRYLGRIAENRKDRRIVQAEGEMEELMLDVCEESVEEQEVGYEVVESLPQSLSARIENLESDLRDLKILLSNNPEVLISIARLDERVNLLREEVKNKTLSSKWIIGIAGGMMAMAISIITLVVTVLTGLFKILQ
ncbi:hypothetical protein KAW48_02725 [candidate division WOR-3 bacterium]|nr:hypothetical protein [candidate division WOR-3 bacterium]